MWGTKDVKMILIICSVGEIQKKEDTPNLKGAWIKLLGTCNVVLGILGDGDLKHGTTSLPQHRNAHFFA